MLEQSFGILIQIFAQTTLQTDLFAVLQACLVMHRRKAYKWPWPLAVKWLRTL